MKAPLAIELPSLSGQPAVVLALCALLALGCRDGAIVEVEVPAAPAPPVGPPPPPPPIPKNSPPAPIHGRVAFDSDRDGTFRIYVADSTGITALARGIQPAWSPDGATIAFQSPAGISLMDADGGNQRLVIPGGLDPSWSPDGRKLVFTDNEVTGGIRIANTDGTDDRLLVAHDFMQDGDGVGRPAWSRDGRRIAFVRYDCCWSWPLEIYLAGLDGSPPRLFSGPVNGVLASQWAPAWSPDGRSIAYVHYFDLTTVDTSGANRRMTGVRAAFEGNVDWSPDGRSLVFSDYSATRSDGSPAGGLRIYVLDIGRAGERQLIPEAPSPAKHDYDDNNPSWARGRP